VDTVGGAVVVGGGVPVPVDTVGGTDESVGGFTNVAEDAVCANESDENARKKNAARTMRKERSDGMFATSDTLLRTSDGERANAEKKSRRVGKVVGNMGWLTFKDAVQSSCMGLHGSMKLISGKISCKPRLGL
jgi:hypothetical protein